MRLTKIKLAGFKSFVDPTTLSLPANLTAVVGPNGCGKSNVIDAVRWVMGESSARQLRGESMADVIFNGSSARKPVGQASIELVFDNSAGRLQGPWGAYKEIAVKRLVNRDGQSQYQLNGTRCRRRDVTDLFLGTGLGPRSYAIIEQGTISRVIEARPEDLRVFFEEAAGISKYKERRRETENRIRHTRENLERLEDLRRELDGQLTRLRRQAEAAERYRRHRAEERRLKAGLLALRWREQDREVTALEARVTDQEVALEGVVGRQRQLEAEIETGREVLAERQQTLERVQERNYHTGTAIARLEQDLDHRREQARRRSEEQEQARSTLVRLEEEARRDQQRREELAAALEEQEPEAEAVQAAEEEAEAALAEAEAALADWQARWEAYNARAAEPRSRAQVERTRIEHLEGQLLGQQRRSERLRLELEGLDAADAEDRLEADRRELEAAAEDLARDQEALEGVERDLHTLGDDLHQARSDLDGARARLQAGRGRLASLEALQEAALGRQNNPAGDWLQSRGLEGLPRLAEQVRVEPGWEAAVEAVLGPVLEAVRVPDLRDPATALETLAKGELALFADRPRRAPHPDTLAARVDCPWELDDWLGPVALSPDLNDALARQGELAPGQSRVTPDGTRLGRHWLLVSRGVDPRQGLLAREREIKTLRETLTRDEALEARRAREAEALGERLAAGEGQRKTLQARVNDGHRELARRQGRVTTAEERLAALRGRRSVLEAELEELEETALEQRETLAEARQRLEEALAAMEQVREEGRELEARRETLGGRVEDCRQGAQAARRLARERTLALEARRSERDALDQGLQRLARERARLEERLDALGREAGSGDDPLDEAQARLEELLEQRLELETRLEAARRAAQDQETALRERERARDQLLKDLQARRQALEEQRLALGETRVRRQNWREQLDQLGAEPATVLGQLPEEAEAGEWQRQLAAVEARIQKLGAVNLAAIEECAKLEERAGYLQAQNDDLVTALTTLENAIRKIDRETRARFKETLERVDRGLRELFPRLFGGGEAWLELVGEDLLDAGVAIMARPPGKRNSTIHLLSGGEKALTAVALVFAIFRLNPAPFCMLDEVDAPLDEANVGRFGALLREMADQVQFIFITHNKGTMEIAHHLAGVTMSEPGVSRLVAVDVDEAVRLAAVAG